MSKEAEAHESRSHFTPMKKSQKSTISKKIKIGISRLFYQCCISSTRDSQMGYEGNTKLDSVHIEKCNNGGLTNPPVANWISIRSLLAIESIHELPSR